MFDFTESTQSIAIVPLSTPLLPGPGAIGTVIVDAHKANSAGHYGMMALVLVALSLTVCLTFLVAPWVSRRLGQIGSTIVTRLMGLPPSRSNSSRAACADFSPH